MAAVMRREGRREGRWEAGGEVGLGGGGASVCFGLGGGVMYHADLLRAHSEIPSEDFFFFCSKLPCGSKYISNR